MMRRMFYVSLFWLAAVASAQVPVDSVRGPVSVMLDPDTRRESPVNPVFTRVNVVITDAVAQAVVTQRFVNPFRAASEVVYVFPLPEQGSVHGMRYEYKGKVYTAEIMEREKAQERYDSARQNGQQAALLLQERPNIFMQRIATMAPGETSYVEIKLSFPLKQVDGEIEMSFPTRIAPRFQSGLAKQARAASQWNPPEDRAGDQFQFNVLVQSGVELSSVYSPTHPIDVGSLEGMKPQLVERRVLDAGAETVQPFVRGVLLQSRTTYANRDYVLRMRRASGLSDFSVASYRDTKGGYFMLSLYPDTAFFTGQRPDLELILLVDVSGSQAGWPLEREKEISRALFARLTPRDNFSVLSFSDQVHYAFSGETPVPATAANLAKAETFVQGLQVQGGTQLLSAINASLAVPTDGSKKRVYIFLTDGFITNESAILAAIREHASRPTIFTFGAGNNLNRYFLEECAKVGDGFATALVQNDPVGPAVEAAWGRIESPQIENIQVDFGAMAPTDLLYPVSRKLYRGLPYRVLGKYGQGGNFTVTLTGDKEGKPVTFTRQVTLTGDENLAWALPKLWAREKIGQLMLAQGTTTSNKSAIVQVSKEHQVLSAYTAFLAIDPQPATRENDIGSGLPSASLEEAMAGLGQLNLEVKHGLLHLMWSGKRMREIRIYDMHGRVLFVYRAASGVARAGEQMTRWIWDGRDASGRRLTAGRYLVRIETEAGVRTAAFQWNP